MQLFDVSTTRRNQHVMDELHGLQASAIFGRFVLVQPDNRRRIICSILPFAGLITNAVFDNSIRIVEEQTLNDVERLSLPIGFGHFVSSFPGIRIGRVRLDAPRKHSNWCVKTHPTWLLAPGQNSSSIFLPPLLTSFSG